MSKIYVDEKLFWVVQDKALLEAEKISCFIRNEYASTIAGKVPFHETWPELWVHHKKDIQKAVEILKSWQEEMKKDHTQPHYPSWKCDQCGESNEGHYALCWSCGTVLNDEEQ